MRGWTIRKIMHLADRREYSRAKGIKPILSQACARKTECLTKRRERRDRHRVSDQPSDISPRGFPDLSNWLRVKNHPPASSVGISVYQIAPQKRSRAGYDVSLPTPPRLGSTANKGINNIIDINTVANSLPRVWQGNRAETEPLDESISPQSRMGTVDDRWLEDHGIKIARIGVFMDLEFDLSLDGFVGAPLPV